MSSYLLVETRDPFESNDTERFWALAEGLADQQNDVVVYLAQNAVMATRQASTKESRLRQLAGKTTVLADDFSLRERAIAAGDLAEGVSVANMDRLVDLVTDGRKVLWH